MRKRINIIYTVLEEPLDLDISSILCGAQPELVLKVISV